MFWSNSSRPPSTTRDYDPSKSRHRRSASDLAHLIHSRREAPSVLDLQSMVRLSGKSSLYLPSEYAPCALILPTCIRATAQYVAQNANTRGIFRIPGSMKVVAAIFDYYCHADKGGADISGTVRSATLPLHIQYSVHDIASTLKRLLSTLPGGILGSLLLFDSFIAIQSNLNAEPEFPRTSQTKVRARLIALAIGTIESQYRRELICAIFGLISMIGRIAEVAPREDEAGLPLPTTDLMGYGALSICFGPLLVGDLLQSYTMKIAAPDSGLVVLPPATQQVRKETRRSRSGSGVKSAQPVVDKILIANRVTEMLISNWRDIVRQMKSLGTHRRRHTSDGSFSKPVFRPSTSETFLKTVPGDFSNIRPSSAIVTSTNNDAASFDITASAATKAKTTNAPKRGSVFLKQKPSVATLSPTIEESPQARRGHGIPIAEEDSTGLPVDTETSSHSQQEPKRSVDTKETQTYMSDYSFSPAKKRFTVPPRLSSIDSAGPKTGATDNARYSQEITDEDNSGKHAKVSSTKRANSGADTPPNFYSPVLSAANAASKTPEGQTPNGRKQENIPALGTPALGSPVVPRRQRAQSPATDSRYQLKRYKRNTFDPLTGSPSKAAPIPRATLTNNVTGGTAWVPTSPFKANPKKLRRSKSGPLRPSATKRDDDVFKPAQRSPVGVWRNGVAQKNPKAGILRSSVSDGISLRASAIRSLIHAGKSRMKSSQNTQSNPPIYGNDQGGSWLRCSKEGLDVYEQPESIIDHLNSHHGFRVSQARVGHSQAAANLYQVIISLHDKLMWQEAEAEALHRKMYSTEQVDAGSSRQDIGMWRRRAESAEKRILIFEKFTERLKDIRDAAMASEQLESRSSDSGDDMPSGNLKLDKDFVAAAARVRFAEVDGSDEPAVSTERKCKRPSVESERSKTCTQCSEAPNLDNGAAGTPTAGPERPRPASFDEVAELWMAAKELLDMDRKDDE